MATLKEDIKTQSAWLVKAFASDKYKLDYSIDSLIEVDRFFANNMKNGKPKRGGRLSKPGYGPILFSIGAYVGETIKKNVPKTTWITDDNDPNGELTISMKLPDGTEIYPMQRVINRFKNGSDDSIYPYAYLITKDITNLKFNERFWQVTAEANNTDKKAWWKFW